MLQTKTSDGSRCPGCQTKLNGASDPLSASRPKPDDLSVCAYCGLLLVFNTDLTVRALKPAELEALDDEERGLLMAYKELVTRARS